MVKCQTRSRFLIFHSTISFSHKKSLFRKFLMTSLYVIFGFSPIIENPGYAYARGGISGSAPQIPACALQARVNFCTSTRGSANFCQKQRHHKRFFSMKRLDKSSKRDQVAYDFAMKTFFYFFGLHFQI